MKQAVDNIGLLCQYESANRSAKCLYGIEQHGQTAVVKLRPAYIHRDGKGWRQDADIVVEQATVAGTQARLPASLADGHLKTPQGPYHNLLDLPLHEEGQVVLSLELFSEEVLHIQGESARVVLHGEPKFVENC